MRILVTTRLGFFIQTAGVKIDCAVSQGAVFTLE
jgi:hypothetical protein